jgi:hypothetical protein
MLNNVRLTHISIFKYSRQNSQNVHEVMKCFVYTPGWGDCNKRGTQRASARACRGVATSLSRSRLNPSHSTCSIFLATRRLNDMVPEQAIERSKPNNPKPRKAMLETLFVLDALTCGARALQYLKASVRRIKSDSSRVCSTFNEDANIFRSPTHK